MMPVLGRRERSPGDDTVHRGTEQAIEYYKHTQHRLAGSSAMVYRSLVRMTM